MFVVVRLNPMLRNEHPLMLSIGHDLTKLPNQKSSLKRTFPTELEGFRILKKLIKETTKLLQFLELKVHLRTTEPKIQLRRQTSPLSRSSPSESEFISSSPFDRLKRQSARGCLRHSRSRCSSMRNTETKNTCSSR